MQDQNPPLKPIKKIKISSVTIFIVFIAFSVVSGIWTNIGTILLEKYIPRPSATNITQVTLAAIVLTALFAKGISIIGLDISNFEENT